MEHEIYRRYFNNYFWGGLDSAVDRADAPLVLDAATARVVSSIPTLY